MNQAVFVFAEAKGPAEALAAELGIPCRPVEVHAFPDGESLVRVRHASKTALLYRSLDRPNDKLIELLLAASALREGGADKVILVAPYLGYMRQDKAFHDGEAVSQRVIGRLIGEHFDGLVTVDPHLHRVARLEKVIPCIPVLVLSAAGVLADALSCDGNVVLVGPDAESRQWVESVAASLKCDVIIGSKKRRGDRRVSLVIPDVGLVRDRPVVLIDDVISSGTTLIAATRLLHSAGAATVDVIATHGLGSRAVFSRIRKAGVRSIRTTLSTDNPGASISIATLLARGIRSADWVNHLP